MAIVHIYQDTKKSEHGYLFPEDVIINGLILEAFHTMALAEELGYNVTIPPRFITDHNSRFTVDRINYSNPFDFFGKLWDVAVKSAEAVADRILYFKPEYRRRELQNELTVQEIAKAKMENVEMAYEFVKKLQNDGMETKDATKVMSQLLSEQGAQLKIERPKERIGD